MSGSRSSIGQLCATFPLLWQKSIHRIDYARPVEFTGPAILALDGERERVIEAGQKVELVLTRTGPKVVDIRKAMHLAAKRGLFIQ